MADRKPIARAIAGTLGGVALELGAARLSDIFGWVFVAFIAASGLAVLGWGWWPEIRAIFPKAGLDRVPRVPPSIIAAVIFATGAFALVLGYNLRGPKLVLRISAVGASQNPSNPAQTDVIIEGWLTNTGQTAGELGSITVKATINGATYDGNYIKYASPYFIEWSGTNYGPELMAKDQLPEQASQPLPAGHKIFGWMVFRFNNLPERTFVNLVHYKITLTDTFNHSSVVLQDTHGEFMLPPPPTNLPTSLPLIPAQP